MFGNNINDWLIEDHGDRLVSCDLERLQDDLLKDTEAYAKSLALGGIVIDELIFVNEEETEKVRYSLKPTHISRLFTNGNPDDVACSFYYFAQ